MVFFAVYALALPLAAGLTLNPKVMSAFTSNNAPAWVQAIGSIVAIAAGFILANSQMNRARRERHEDEAAVLLLRKRQAADYGLLVMRRLATSKLTLASPRIGRSDIMILRRSIENDLRAMETFPVWDLVDSKPIDQFLQLAGILGVVLDTVAEIELTMREGPHETIPDVLAAARSNVDDVAKTAVSRWADLKAAVTT